ncbi:MAG: TrkH family potassium uptake protein [Alphaproteobacteria bacterium]
MTDFRPILLVIGVLLTTVALAMLFPAIADSIDGNSGWRVFLASALVSLFIGVSLVLVNRGEPAKLSVRQAFLLTALSWIFISAVAALPFVFADLGLSYTDAFFEAVSGLTTTGSTVIVGLDDAPPGILLWRAILQWLGGIGIIIMAVAVLPMLQVGGMQLFRTEQAADQSEKVLPRAAQIAGAIGIIYLALTALNAICYWFAGMSTFEAVCHAMTTIATGGYSTSDESIGHFNSTGIEAIATIFMVAGSLPFILYLQAARGRARALITENQVHWFIGIVLACFFAMAAWLASVESYTAGDAFRLSAFNVVSVMTGTGYASADYSLWGTFPVTLLFLLMFIGGCTGSTTGGIKIFRIHVLYTTARVQMLRLLQPHGVFLAHYNGKPIPEGIAGAVMGFFFLFALCFGILAVGLALFGLDFMTCLSGAASALANVGPGLGPIIGPSGSYAPLPDGAKWLLSFAMLLGRLELFTILVLFVPSFWRR